MSEPRPCITCHRPTQLSAVESASGEQKMLSLTVRKLPVLVCEEGHKQFINADFPLQVLTHLVEEDEPQLPAGTEKGLVFKHFYCQECQKELQAKPDHRHTFTVDLALPAVPRFSVDLTMPVYRCEGCGKEQLHSIKEVRQQTPAALMHALQSAGIANT